MKYSTSKNNQHGFSIIYILLAFLVVGLVGFTGGVVYRANQQVNSNAKQAENLPDTTQTADTKKIVLEEAPKPVEEPKPAESKPVEPTPTVKKTEPAPEKQKETPSYTVVQIASTSAIITADTVSLAANLPANYDGTCKALIKQDGGVNAQWYEATFSSATTCSVAIPKSKFPATGTWYFYMYFKSNDGKTKGQSGSNSFVL